MKDEGFGNDVNITSEFLSSTNLFETYASSCFDGRGKLLLKAFAKVIKGDDGKLVYGRFPRKIFMLILPRDIVSVFNDNGFDGIRSDNFNFELIRKFLVYAESSSIFIHLVKKGEKKNIKFVFDLVRRLIITRKLKIQFILEAYSEISGSDINIIGNQLYISFKNYSEKRRLDLYNRLLSN